MRPTASVLGFGAAGCQAVPDLAAQPHPTLAGTHLDVDGDRYDNFHVRKIDGNAGAAGRRPADAPPPPTRPEPSGA